MLNDLITRIGVVFSGLLAKEGKRQVTRMARRTLFFSMVFALSACGGDDDNEQKFYFHQHLPELYAYADDSEIRLTWDAIPNSVSYTLCYATQSLGELANLDHCAIYTNGTLVQNLGTGTKGTSHTVTGLTNGTTYYFSLVAVDGNSNPSTPSVQVSAAPKKLVVISASGKLNDTGITWGGGYPGGNNTDCTGEEIAQQDCSHGRDATHNDNSDGHAGISFTKLDSNGNALSASASVWNCVQDNVTGLTWEVKTAAAGGAGLHDNADTYDWYNTNSSTNGGAEGYANARGDTCEGYINGQPATYCNTQAFTARVNEAELCGAEAWRMPTITELQGIVNYGTTNPAIDTVYFPNTVSAYYWSSSPNVNNNYSAWVVYFGYGYDNNYYYNNDYRVRLVSSER